MCEGIVMNEQEISATHLTSFEAVGLAIAEFDSTLSAYPFRSNLLHTVVLGLAQRLIEFSRGSEALGRMGLAAANAAMVRMCLETVFKLKAICQGAVSAEDYVKQELVAQHQSIKRVLNRPGLRDTYTDQQLDELRGEVEHIEQQLGKKIKVHEIKPWQWAEIAGEGDMYALTYSILSDYVHSGATSLSHIMDIRDQGQVFIQTGPSTHQLEMMLQGVCISLAMAKEAIQSMRSTDP